MTVQPHNTKAAATWGAGGAAYDRVSETIADSIEHILSRLDVQAGERVLDLATGIVWQTQGSPRPVEQNWTALSVTPAERRVCNAPYGFRDGRRLDFVASVARQSPTSRRSVAILAQRRLGRHDLLLSKSPLVPAGLARAGANSQPSSFYRSPSPLSPGITHPHKSSSGRDRR